jgi:hypothetical protein
MEQVVGQPVVVVHHVFAIGFHGVTAGTLVKDGFDLTKRTVQKRLVKILDVQVVRYLKIGQVAKLVALRHVIDRDDVGDATGVQPLDDVTANETGRPGDNDSCHANNSL